MVRVDFDRTSKRVPAQHWMNAQGTPVPETPSGRSADVTPDGASTIVEVGGQVEQVGHVDAVVEVLPSGALEQPRIAP